MFFQLKLRIYSQTRILNDYFKLTECCQRGSSAVHHVYKTQLAISVKWKFRFFIYIMPDLSRRPIRPTAFVYIWIFIIRTFHFRGKSKSAETIYLVRALLIYTGLCLGPIKTFKLEPKQIQRNMR